MGNLNPALFAAIIVMASGCGSDTAKMTAYETLQNIRDRDCMNNPALDCGKREPYEAYRRKRDELEPAE